MVYNAMKEKKTKVTIEMVMKLRSHSGTLTDEVDWLQMARFHAEWSKKFDDVIVSYLVK